MTLEQRIQRLEDIEAIRTLKHSYCDFCDQDYDPKGISNLFAEDGVWDGGAFGRFQGRQAIHDGFAAAAEQVEFAIHQVSNEIIEVDGDTATGKWFLWQPMVSADGQALWMGARYNERYVRVDGNWMFQELVLDIRMMSPYEQGFGKMRFPPAQ
ncbi:MAG: nuclear transport factor 2 family protein [Halopseudomonas sp.]